MQEQTSAASSWDTWIGRFSIPPRCWSSPTAGSVLEYDLFGWESSYYSLGPHDMIHDGQRLDYAEMLIEAGHLDKIVLGQDVFSKARTSTYGGYGYGHLIENIVPRMRERGIPEESHPSGDDLTIQREFLRSPNHAVGDRGTPLYSLVRS